MPSLKETDMTILITSQDMKIITTIEIDNNIATIDKEGHRDLIHLLQIDTIEIEGLLERKVL